MEGVGGGADGGRSYRKPPCGSSAETRQVKKAVLNKSRGHICGLAQHLVKSSCVSATKIQGSFRWSWSIRFSSQERGGVLSLRCLRMHPFTYFPREPNPGGFRSPSQQEELKCHHAGCAEAPAVELGCFVPIAKAEFEGRARCQVPYFVFCFCFVLCLYPQLICKVPGQGLNPSYNCSNTGSLTHCTRPEFKLVPLQSQARSLSCCATAGTPNSSYFKFTNIPIKWTINATWKPTRPP